MTRVLAGCGPGRTTAGMRQPQQRGGPGASAVVRRIHRSARPVTPCRRESQRTAHRRRQMVQLAPPASTPIWSRVTHVSPIRPGTEAGGPSPMRWAWLLPSQVRVIMAVCSRASAPPEPAGQRCLEQAPCDTGYVIGTAQVTGPLTSRRYRYRPAGCRKGPPQVHRRSVRGQRKLARQRLTGSRFIHGRPLPSVGQAGHAGAVCCPGVAARRKRRDVSRHGSAPVHGDTPVPAGFSRRSPIPRPMRARPPTR
jgi:hypothetical protein